MKQLEFWTSFFSKLDVFAFIFPSSQISEAVNKYSVNHQQDLTLSTLEHRTLSEPTYVHSFDFRQESECSDETNAVSVVGNLTDSGTVHAIIYWLTFSLNF
jgi:hypothetical protein